MKHIHLVGIGGTGLAPIARVLAERGYQVSGSDQALSPLARDLESLGIAVKIGHAAANIEGADIVVRSSAVNESNPEVAAALARGIPVLKRSEFLGELLAGDLPLAVAGTHGKTTTTAMLAWVLSALGEEPSYIIGGTAKNLGRNARAGKGKWFAIEADEYDNMFLGVHPQAAIVTTMEHDHPDCFPTPADYQAAFEKFVASLRPGGVLLVSAESASSRGLVNSLPAGCTARTFGEGGDFSLSDLRTNAAGGYSFTAGLAGGEQVAVDLQVPGKHNAMNALAVLGLIQSLGLPVGAAAAALAEFSGVGRRFDLRGEAAGVTVIDDYGHHPTEIRTTLAGARARFGERRIWAVWQPHTYSRTRTLFSEFVQAFADADQVVVTEIYPSRETVATISSREVVAAMQRSSAYYAANLSAAVELLVNNLRAGDVLIVFSAGDADQISAEVLARLEKVVKHD